MIIFLFNFFLGLAISMLVFLASFVLSARSSIDRENSSPFECGFDPNNNARVPFSTRFFLLAVIFLVFDIEIALLIPIPLILASHAPLSSIIGATLFFLILILGLVHEWNEGSLNWTI